MRGESYGQEAQLWEKAARFFWGVFNWDDGRGVTVAAAELQFGVAAVLHGSATDGGAQGHSEQVGIAELDTGGFVTVVVEDFETRRR